jgi:hypothetical protein
MSEEKVGSPLVFSEITVDKIAPLNTAQEWKKCKM